MTNLTTLLLLLVPLQGAGQDEDDHDHAHDETAPGLQPPFSLVPS